MKGACSRIAPTRYRRVTAWGPRSYLPAVRDAAASPADTRRRGPGRRSHRGAAAEGRDTRRRRSRAPSHHGSGRLREASGAGPVRESPFLRTGIETSRSACPQSRPLTGLEPRSTTPDGLRTCLRRTIAGLHGGTIRIEWLPGACPTLVFSPLGGPGRPKGVYPSLSAVRVPTARGITPEVIPCLNRRTATAWPVLPPDPGR
jgi:hypothetical protein